MEEKELKNRLIQTLTGVLYLPTLSDDIKKETETKLLELIKGL